MSNKNEPVVIPAALIRLGENYKCTTNNNGECVLHDVNEDDYDLLARAVSYADYNHSIRVNNSETVLIEMEKYQYAFDGLIGWYDGILSEKSTTQLQDMSGQDNHGTMANFNSDSWKDDNALYFNGTNTLATLPIKQASLKDGCTIETVVKIDTRANNRGVIGSDVITNPALLFLQTNTTATISFGFNGGAVKSAAAGLIPYGYAHILMTFNGANTCKLYVNGVHVDTTTSTATNLELNTGNICIGRGYNDASTRFFLGTLKCVMIYDRVLDDFEIRQNHRVHVNRGFLDEKPLLMSYLANDHGPTNTVWEDRSVNKFNASIAGFSDTSWQADGSANFNGSNTLLTLPTPITQLALSGGCSLEMVLKDRGRGVATRGWAGDHGATSSIALLFHRWENATNITTGWYGLEGMRMTVPGSNLPIDQYYHTVLTYDGVKWMRFYVNGVFIQEMDIGDRTFNTAAILIGRASNAAAQYALGDLKLFNIYHRALTPNEIANNYNEYLADDLVPNVYGLLASYDASDYGSDVTRWKDLSGRGNTGVLFNATENNWKDDGSFEFLGTQYMNSISQMLFNFKGGTLELVLKYNTVASNNTVNAGATGDYTGGNFSNISAYLSGNNMWSGFYNGKHHTFPIAGNVPDGYFYFAMTYDRNMLKTYINGKLIKEDAMGAFVVIHQLLTLGRPNATASQYFKGNVKLFKIHSVPLTSDEISQNQEQYVLQGYIPFDLKFKVTDYDDIVLDDTKIILNNTEYVTNINGELTIKDVKAGLYEIEIAKEGYDSEFISQFIKEEKEFIIKLEEENSGRDKTHTLDFIITEIIDDELVHLENAVVKLDSIECTTDENGKCSLTNITKGFKDLNISYEDYPEYKERVRILNDEIFEINLKQENYVTDDLIVRYEADNPLNTVSSWYDMSENNNTGVLVGGKVDSYKDDRSFLFEGSQYVETVNQNLFNANGCTLECIVKYNAKPSTAGVIANVANSATFHVMFGYWNPGLFFNGFWNGRHNSVAESNVPTGYFHLVMTWDKANVRVYINNALVMTLATAAFTLPSWLMRIGGIVSGTNLQGNIKNFMIYNRGLTAQEVEQNYLEHIKRKLLGGGGVIVDPEPVHPNLQASYVPNNNISTTWTDSSGKGNNATMANFNNDSYQIDGSLKFNGSNTLVTLPFTQRQAIVNGSLEFIIKYGTLANYRGWFGDHNAATGTNLQFLVQNTDTKIDIGFYDGVGVTNMFEVTTKATFNNYTHVVFTYNNNIIRLYINGVLFGSKTIGAKTIATTSLFLGRSLVGSGRYCDGNLRLCNVYNKVLDQSEVTENYNKFVKEGRL
jgi:hypothetical protein